MSANFFDGNNLKPFRFWCQKVLPLVYDDSLSYYELLCRVVDYINKLIDDETQLVEAYSKLQDYVNNYFDNLDVTEEINNKLDEMAKDGSLNSLIANYINPLIDEQTAYNVETREILGSQIAAQNNEIAGIRAAVGSPLKASTAAEMNDENRIYVYTGNESGYVNGNWYYYNGSAWASGGVYNATSYTTDKTLSLPGEPADAAITGNEITKLYNGSKNNRTETALTFTRGHSISSVDGNITNTTNIRAATLDYYKSQDLISGTINTNYLIQICLYDANKMFILCTDWISEAFTLETKGASYFRALCKLIDGSDIPENPPVFTSGLFTTGTLLNYINNRTAIGSNKQIVIDAAQHSGAINAALTSNPEVGAYKVIDVMPGEKYYVSGYVYANVYPLILLTLDDHLIQQVPGGSVGSTVNNYLITIPANRNKMYVNGKPGEIKIVKVANNVKDMIEVLGEEKQPKVLQTLENYYDISKATETGSITPSLTPNPSVGGHIMYNVTPGDIYKISGYVYVKDIYPLIIFYNENTLVSYINGRNSAGEVTNYEIEIPDGVTTMYVNGRPNNIVVVKKTNTVENTLSYIIDKQDSGYKNKKIVWFGTSIPAGGFLGRDYPNSYPGQVGRILECTVINEAIGSSCITCKSPDRITTQNPYGFNTNFEASSRCITNTVEEMNWIIEHRNDSFWTAGQVSDWSDWWANLIRSFSYENLIDKYLTVNTMPDVFVFDYGHNDSDYTDAQYQQYGTFSPLTFRGGMNFLIRRILNYKPDARIIMIGEYANTRQVPENQMKIAADWDLPIIKLWDLLGWSKTMQITTNGRWVYNSNTAKYEWVTGSTTQSVFDAVIPDKIHPFTDPSGKPVEKMARVIAAQLKTF